MLKEIKKLNSQLWIYFITFLLVIPYIIYQLYKDSCITNKDLQQKQIMLHLKNLFSYITEFALRISMIFLTGPLAVILSALKALLETSFDLSIAVYNRFCVEGVKENNVVQQISNDIKQEMIEHAPLPQNQMTELTKHINILHRLNADVINKAHNTCLHLVALVGISLLFTPAAAVGTTTLTLLSIYYLLDRLDLNPLHYAFKIINRKLNNPFYPVTEKEVIAKLRQYEPISAKVTNDCSVAYILNKLGFDRTKHAFVMAENQFLSQNEQNNRDVRLSEKEQSEAFPNIFLPRSSHQQCLTCSM